MPATSPVHSLTPDYVIDALKRGASFCWSGNGFAVGLIMSGKG